MPRQVLTSLADSVPLEQRTGFKAGSAFARAIFSTSATAMRIDTYNDVYDLFPSYTSFGLIINGVYTSTLSPGQLGDVSFDITMAAGLKTVEIVAGFQTHAYPQLGSHIQAVSANATLTQLFDDTANPRLVIYGDSIASGDDATPTPQNAWTMKVRAAYSGSVGVEAWGYRTLKDDAATSLLRAAFIARLLTYNPTKIWFAIGTNDYALNNWASAALFGAAYAAVLDDLHTASPSLSIYAQSPLIRSDEGVNNASGWSVGDARAAIVTACSGRGWVQYVNGSTILALGDLVDGVHPTTAGHAKYATSVLATLAP